MENSMAKLKQTITVEECRPPTADHLLDMLDIEGSVLKKRPVSIMNLGTPYVLDPVKVDEAIFERLTKKKEEVLPVKEEKPLPVQKVWEFIAPTNPPVENRASAYTPEYIRNKLEKYRKREEKNQVARMIREGRPSPNEKKPRSLKPYQNMTAEELWNSVTYNEYVSLSQSSAEKYDLTKALQVAGKAYCRAYDEETFHSNRPAPAGAPEKGRWICCCCDPDCRAGPFNVWMPGC